MATAPPGQDPGILIEAMTAGMSSDGPYRDPVAEERAQARRAVRLLLEQPDDLAGQDEVFESLGMRAIHDVDVATGRAFSIFIAVGSDERAWGALLVDRSETPQHLIEVPHPAFDLNTEKLGLALQQRLPGSVLLVAGAHRAAAGGSADVAHNSGSLFHVLATEFARGGLPQIQLHGFADKNLPDAQVVVSTGAAEVTTLARELATALADAGLVTCRAWSAKCGQLEGTRNEQGQMAAELDRTFIHLELGWSVRRQESNRELVARTIADQLAVG